MVSKGESTEESELLLELRLEPFNEPCKGFALSAGEPSVGLPLGLDGE